MACFSPVVNTRGAIFTHKDGIVLRPTYFVFDLYANLLKDTVLNLWTEDVPTVTGSLDNRERTVGLVDAVVTCGEGGYAIAAINKDPENTQTMELRMLDDSVTEMRIHTINGPSTGSYNDIDRTEVGVTVSEWTAFTGSISLEPHSVNVIELR
jgi:alpha-N-arabinofuranosidase